MNPLPHTKTCSGSFKHKIYFSSRKKKGLSSFYKGMRVVVSDITTEPPNPRGLIPRTFFLADICFSLTQSPKQAALLTHWVRDLRLLISWPHTPWHMAPEGARLLRLHAFLAYSSYSSGQNSVMWSYPSARKAKKDMLSAGLQGKQTGWFIVVSVPWQEKPKPRDVK